MFCPQCKAEYRSGFNRCSDCNVDLVDHVPESVPQSDHDAVMNAGVMEGSPLRSVLSTEDRAECVYVCEQFKAAKVPFKVIQRRHQFFKGVDEHFDVLVPENIRQKATE